MPDSGQKLQIVEFCRITPNLQWFFISTVDHSIYAISTCRRCYTYTSDFDFLTLGVVIFYAGLGVEDNLSFCIMFWQALKFSYPSTLRPQKNPEKIFNSLRVLVKWAGVEKTANAAMVFRSAVCGHAYICMCLL